MSSYTKPKIYNLALSALLLSYEVSNVDTDTSNEVRVLNTHWDTAFESTLQDLDLDSLSQPVTLELLTTLDEGPWRYVYKYPTKCSYLRRIDSGYETDNKQTHISKRTGIYNGHKVIFCNEEDAVAECITNDIPLNALSPMAALAIAYNLASLAAPLITGKGAKALKDKIDESYIGVKAKAQEIDQRENFVYEHESLRSEWVNERMS